MTDVSDRSSELVSPVSSLPPETPTSPPSNTFTYNSPLSSPSMTTPTADGSASGGSNGTVVNQYQPPAPVPQQQHNYRSPAGGNDVLPVVDTISSFSAETGYPPRVMYPSGQRPGSLALSSLAESGMLSDRAGQVARPGSLAAPCNTLGIPPAPPPTRAISAATGLNQSSAYGDSRQPMFSPTKYEQTQQTTHFNTSGTVTNGGLYTIKQDSPTSPIAPTGLPSCNSANISDNSLKNGYDNQSSNILSRQCSNSDSSEPTGRATPLNSRIPDTQMYASPVSRIPMNRQNSSSSYNSQHSNDSSRIPSSNTGIKLPSYSGPDNSSRIPSMSSTRRSSNSSLGHKAPDYDAYNNADNAAPSNGLTESPDPRHSGIKPPTSYRTGPAAAINNSSSRIPYSGSPITYNGNKSQPQTPSNGSQRKLTPPLSSNGSGIRAPNNYSTSGTTHKASGIIPPGYVRSNSSLSNSDKESKLPTMNSNSSFGKSNIPAGAIPSNMTGKNNSRIPSSSYSPNTSFESSKDYQRPPSQSRLVSPPSYSAGGGGYKSPNSGGLYNTTTSSGGGGSGGGGGDVSANSPVNHAINTPGLPPLPVAESKKTRQSTSQMPQPKAGSRIPQFGGKIKYVDFKYH